MLTKPAPYDLVEVVWLDASGESGWKAESEVNEDHVEVTSVGFLIKSTKKSVILAGSYYKGDTEYHLGSNDAIPKSMVKKINVLVPKNASKSITVNNKVS